jgi:hypothetical protein
VLRDLDTSVACLIKKTITSEPADELFEDLREVRRLVHFLLRDAGQFHAEVGQMRLAKRADVGMKLAHDFARFDVDEARWEFNDLVLSWVKNTNIKCV